MKLFIILAVTALCNGAKLDRTYLPPNAQTSGGSDSILLTPLSQQPLQNEPARNFPLNSFSRNNQLGAAGFGPTDQSNVYSSDVNGIQNAQYQTGFNNLGGYDDKPERAQAAFERNAAILRQSNENDGDKYSYAYETENGIYAEENGVATNGVEAEGGFAYTGDDGKVYTIRYTADQNGFVPQGEHLPTPPPVPEEILKALEQNARDEAAGIYDDGTYNEAKYANEDAQGYNFNANNNQYSNANNQINTDAIVVNSANPSGPRTSFGVPLASSITPGFGRTTNFGNTAPDFNTAADFGKTSRTYENRNPVPSFASKNLSSGNNAPSFGFNSFPSVPSSLSFNSNTLAVATPAFGRSGPAASPVYGPPTAPGISTTGFSRTAPTSENNAPSFGQRTVGVSATSDNIRGDVEKAYLPPFQRQTNQNGRTQSFNENDGYRY